MSASRRRWPLGMLLIGLFAPGSPAAESDLPTYGQQVVAAVLMGEAWGEGEAGMTAVAEVIRNRADAAKLSPLAVVTQRYQFTCLNRATPAKLVQKYCRHRDYQVALRIARQMYNRPQALPGHSRGATHFERHGTRADWTRGLQPVARVGRLSFFRVPPPE